MFYPEEIERQILHNSTSKKIYNNKPLVGAGNNVLERKIGGSKNGVSILKPSSNMTGGGKNVWQTLIKSTMKDKNLSMKEAIKYIKSNNLY